MAVRVELPIETLRTVLEAAIQSNKRFANDAKKNAMIRELHRKDAAQLSEALTKLTETK